MDEKIASIWNELHEAFSLGYLSLEQINIVEAPLTHYFTYSPLIEQFGISGRTPLAHALQRTAALVENWANGMGATGNSYLSKYDVNQFLKILQDANDDWNCIPAIYAISLAHYLKKKRNSRAFYEAINGSVRWCGSILRWTPLTIYYFCWLPLIAEIWLPDSTNPIIHHTLGCITK